MKLNRKEILNLRPCTGGLMHYICNYPGFEGTLEEHMKLALIPFKDKAWIFYQIASKEEIRDLVLLMDSLCLDNPDLVSNIGPLALQMISSIRSL